MLLKDKFYKVLNEEKDGMTGRYTIAILPDCDVYDGHFPGDPVCPGVCNIETIKECAMMLLGKALRIKAIKQCRLTAIATPTVCPEVTINLTATPATDNDSYIIVADISDEKQSYMNFKGTLA